MPQTHVFKTPEEVAKESALFLKKKVEQKEGLFNWALSGGSTPKILFDYLAEQYKETFPWSKLQLFWGDERCVPPTDDDSNYKMTHERLLSKVDIPAEQIHRIKGEAKPEEEVVRYSQLLLEKVGTPLPQLDLVMLGMGSDGHTASIFPNQMHLLTAESLCGIAQHPETGQQRITMNGKVINAAKTIAFLVTGANKKEKVTHILENAVRAEQYPAAHITPNNGELHWFLDTQAFPK